MSKTEDFPLQNELARLHKLFEVTSFREKLGKVIQYSAKSGAYYLKQNGYGDEHADTIKNLKSVAKYTSAARRIFKFGKFVKHFDDLPDALDEDNSVVQGVFVLEFVFNMAKDIAENCETAQKYGFVPYDMLPANMSLIADSVKFVQCVVCIAVNLIDISRKWQKLDTLESLVKYEKDPEKRDQYLKNIAKCRGKLVLKYFSTVKYFCNCMKSANDLEFSWAPTDGVALSAGLVSGFCDLRKQIVKHY